MSPINFVQIAPEYPSGVTFYYILSWYEFITFIFSEHATLMQKFFPRRLSYFTSKYTLGANYIFWLILKVPAELCVTCGVFIEIESLTLYIFISSTLVSEHWELAPKITRRRPPGDLDDKPNPLFFRSFRLGQKLWVLKLKIPQLVWRNLPPPPPAPLSPFPPILRVLLPIFTATTGCRQTLLPKVVVPRFQKVASCQKFLNYSPARGDSSFPNFNHGDLEMDLQILAERHEGIFRSSHPCEFFHPPLQLSLVPDRLSSQK